MTLQAHSLPVLPAFVERDYSALREQTALQEQFAFAVLDCSLLLKVPLFHALQLMCGMLQVHCYVYRMNVQLLTG